MTCDFFSEFYASQKEKNDMWIGILGKFLARSMCFLRKNADFSTCFTDLKPYAKRMEKLTWRRLENFTRQSRFDAGGDLKT